MGGGGFKGASHPFLGPGPRGMLIRPWIGDFIGSNCCCVDYSHICVIWLAVPDAPSAFEMLSVAVYGAPALEGPMT